MIYRIRFNLGGKVEFKSDTPFFNEATVKGCAQEIVSKFPDAIVTVEEVKTVETLTGSTAK